MTVLELPVKSKTCEICSSKLPPQRSKFCSKKCQNEFYALNRVEVTCKNCQKLFIVTKARVKTRKFCKLQCRREWEANNFVVRRPRKNIKRKVKAKPKKKELKKEVLIPKKKDPVVIVEKRSNYVPCQKTQHELNDMLKIVIMPNTEIERWRTNLYELIKRLNGSLSNTLVEKFTYEYGSLVIIPRTDSYEKTKLVVKQHVDLVCFNILEL